MLPSFRGSRKHILDWVESPAFVEEFNALLAPSGATISANDSWMPQGRTQALEARLETFGPRVLPGVLNWNDVRNWWLVHHRGANTPNWDLASTCSLNGRRGLVLVEAKANVPELKTDGKSLGESASLRSSENHERIGTAISQAREALQAQVSGIAISRDKHFQLSNRVAFAWRLASLGLPTVLVYLGFTGDEGIRDVGEPFESSEHWQHAFSQHARSVIPKMPYDDPIHCGLAPFWLLVRSRGVIEHSLPREDRSR